MRKVIYFWFMFMLFLASLLLITFDDFISLDYLGSGLVIMHGDNEKDKVILYKERLNDLYVVPTYNRHMKNGEYAEYIFGDVKDNDKWVVARTMIVETRELNYWIIRKFSISDIDCNKVNCDSVVKTYVIGPLSINNFNRKKEELDINLTFDIAMKGE